MKKLSMVFVLLLSSLAFADSDTSLLDQYCPSRLALQADVGPVNPSNDDIGYRDLGNSRIQGVFVRSYSGNTCLLVEDTTGQTEGGVSRSRYVEVKKAQDGVVRVTLEGYTTSGKIFSIRTRLEEGQILTGRYPAIVFEGNGGRERIGEAVILADDLGR
jgi:hypothetical protein